MTIKTIHLHATVCCGNSSSDDGFIRRVRFADDLDKLRLCFASVSCGMYTRAFLMRDDIRVGKMVLANMHVIKYLT